MKTENLPHIKLLKQIRRAYCKFFIPNFANKSTDMYVKYWNQDASDIIRDRLLNAAPAMIGRFGATELNCVSNYLFTKKDKYSILDYIKGNAEPFFFDEQSVLSMRSLSGFFSPEISLLEKYSEMSISEMRQIDVLGSWLKQEKYFFNELNESQFINMAALEPYYHQNPWTTALEGKKVLVIHPFEESIRSQYKKRELLFDNKNVLPAFELKTIKAVQSLDSNGVQFSNWFEALDSMKVKIDQADFDIAILGCGAYAMPLAAYIKSLGKKSVVLAGATQLLFGIRGKRWEKHPYISKLFNEHWVSPLPSETPPVSVINRVEGATYW